MKKKKRKNKKQNLQNHSKTPTVQLTASPKTRGSGINGPVWIYLLLNTMPYKVLLPFVPHRNHPLSIRPCKSLRGKSFRLNHGHGPARIIPFWMINGILFGRTSNFLLLSSLFCRFFLLGSIVLLSFSGCCRQAAAVLNLQLFFFDVFSNENMFIGLGIISRKLCSKFIGNFVRIAN